MYLDLSRLVEQHFLARQLHEKRLLKLAGVLSKYCLQPFALNQVQELE
jgi:hypothetical protein